MNNFKLKNLKEITKEVRNPSQEDLDTLIESHYSYIAAYLEGEALKGRECGMYELQLPYTDIPIDKLLKTCKSMREIEQVCLSIGADLSVQLSSVKQPSLLLYFVWDR